MGIMLFVTPGHAAAGRRRTEGVKERCVMERALVSILTLSYNNFENMEECIDSIFSQDYGNMEWILSDDGSGQFGTWKERIEAYIEEKHPVSNVKKVTILHDGTNLGIVRNYKRALDAAEGKYIFYLAMGDSFFDPNVITDVAAYFERSDVDVFGGCWEWIKDGKKEFRPEDRIKKLFADGDSERIYEYFIRYPLFVGACTPFRRDLYSDFGFLPAEYTHLEDWPRYLDWIEKGARIGFLDRVLIRYYAGGLTTKIKNPDLIMDFKHLLEKRMRLPHSALFRALKTKKYIFSWGAAGGFLMNYQSWEEAVGRQCDYLIDKNPEKAGQTIAGRPVILPEELKKFSPEEIFILIFSRGYFFEISEELEQMGFVLGEHFDLISRELLLWKCGRYDEDEI